MEWINVKSELPPKDGFYEVSTKEIPTAPEGYSYYNGVNFHVENYLIPTFGVLFWRQRNETKRYGKIDGMAC